MDEPHAEPPSPADAPPAPGGSFLQTVRMVAWSFIGIRRSAGHAEDARRVNPLHVIVAAVIGVALFVLLLAGLVHWVISSGAART